MIVLAIETSCDETSVAVVKDGKEVLSNIVFSQIDIHKEFGGVVPEIASRHHIASITTVFQKGIEEAGISKSDIDYVAVTEGPGLIGSLLVGINAAKAFALANSLPVIGIHHIAGHIYANALVGEFTFPVLALVVSGGHTELVLMKDHYQFERIGTTYDDAVGEAYDKVARTIGLGYPGGPEVDKRALLGEDTYQLPRVWVDKNSYDFSFSGLKSAVINKVHNANQKGEEIDVNNMCASFQESVIDVLVTKTLNAAQEFHVKTVIVAGGVAANKGLRNRLSSEIGHLESTKLVIPPFEYCTDNAAMIGAAAYYYMTNVDNKDITYIKGNPNLKL